MEIPVNAVYILVSVLAIGIYVPMVVRAFLRWRDANRRAIELREAEELLSKHGYQACLNLPAAGIQNDAIATALRHVSRSSDRLILTSTGQLVGKVSPDTLSPEHGLSEPTASRPQLTLVVSNPSPTKTT